MALSTQHICPLTDTQRANVTLKFQESLADYGYWLLVQKKLFLLRFMQMYAMQLNVAESCFTDNKFQGHVSAQTHNLANLRY